MPENPLSTVMKMDPELAQRMKALDNWALADGVLPRKIKLLMALAFDAAHGAADGVRALGRQALEAGATKEEIGETLRVALALSGVGSVWVSSVALRDVVT